MKHNECLLYLAGIVDGEGCIGIYMSKPGGKNRKHYPRPQLVVANTNKALVDWCKNEFGGYIVCQKPRKTNWSPCYRWIIQYSPAIELLKELFQYLIVKRSVAERVINQMALYRDTGSFQTNLPNTFQ